MASATTPGQTRENLLGPADAAARTRARPPGPTVVAAGVPDVDGGAEMARPLRRPRSTRVRDAYRHARTDLAALPTADATSFYDGVVAVLGRLRHRVRRECGSTRPTWTRLRSGRHSTESISVGNPTTVPARCRGRSAQAGARRLLAELAFAETGPGRPYIVSGLVGLFSSNRAPCGAWCVLMPGRD